MPQNNVDPFAGDIAFLGFCNRIVEYGEELFQRILIHSVDVAHFDDQKVQY